jgi:hypothetical protein
MSRARPINFRVLILAPVFAMVAASRQHILSP